MYCDIISQYDDILRLSNVLLEGDLEPEFLRFVLNADEIRARLSEAQNTCERLLKELQHVNLTRSGIERKLDSVRQMYDFEKKKRSVAETTVKDLEKRLALCSDTVRQEQKKTSGQTQRMVTFDCRSDSYSGDAKQRGSLGNRLREPEGGISRISEGLDLTGSLISELGYTRSEEELEISRMLSPGNRKRRHSSLVDEPEELKKIRSNVEACPFGPPNDPKNPTPKECRLLMTKTHVTTAQEAKTGNSSQEKLTKNYESPERGIVTPTQTKSMSIPSNSPRFSDSDDCMICGDLVDAPLYPSPSACHSGVNLMACDRHNNRTHSFCPKTIIIPETCEPCGRRLKFGKIAVKCRDCRATVHLDCKDDLPSPCVPTNCTPIAKGQMGFVSDYSPFSPPMVPALIVYCVNEIETRGLNEVGIYRIVGSERDVRSLKEKFLRGRGAPNLSNIDIHVLCGTVKDFLKSLREPLVTSSLLSDFIRCIETSEESDQQGRLYQAVADLPRPNRDTLAFMILHLQRVSDCPECRMPVDRLAKVFGPTFVGYSSKNPDPATMLVETMKQEAIMKLMMKTPSSYWACYVNSTHETVVCENRTPETRQVFNNDSSLAAFQRTKFFSASMGSFNLNKRGKFFNNL